MEWGGGCLPAPSSMVSPFTNGIKVDSVKLILTEFPSIFPVQFSFFFLVSCTFSLLSISELLFPEWGVFYILRSLQVVLVTLSCEAGRKEIRKFRVARV